MTCFLSIHSKSSCYWLCCLNLNNENYFCVMTLVYFKYVGCSIEQVVFYWKWFLTIFCIFALEYMCSFWVTLVVSSNLFVMFLLLLLFLLWWWELLLVQVLGTPENSEHWKWLSVTKSGASWGIAFPRMDKHPWHLCLMLPAACPPSFLLEVYYWTICV